MGSEEISLEMKREPFLLNNCVVVTAKRRNQLISSISLWVAPAQICTKEGQDPPQQGRAADTTLGTSNLAPRLVQFGRAD